MKRFCFYFLLPVFLLINYFILYLLLKTLFSFPLNKKCLNELLYFTIFIILKMCMPCKAVRGEIKSATNPSSIIPTGKLLNTTCE